MKKIFYVLFLFFLASCQAAGKIIEFSNVVSLDVYEDSGTVHLLLGGYLEGEKVMKLRYIKSYDSGETWSRPVAIATGNTFPHSITTRGKDARLVAVGDSLVVTWMIEGTGFMKTGPMRTSLSSDGGRTWHLGPDPSDSGLESAHRFQAFTVNSNRLHLIWLDKRSGNSGLYYSYSKNNGKVWSDNVELDALTCTCCWNVLCSGKEGELFALYRDAIPRDMALVSSIDNGRSWASPVFVGEFGWKFDGCPHTGGALVADASTALTQLHSVVWSGQEKNRGLSYLKSIDAGKTWSLVKKIGSPKAKNSSVSCNAKGQVAIVWDQSDAQGQHIYGMLSLDRGQTWSKAKQLSKGNDKAHHPRVVSSLNSFKVFWTQKTTDGASWKMTELIKE